MGIQGGDGGLEGPTLGAAAGGSVCFRRGGVFTLGAAASCYCCCCGILSTRFSCIAKVKSALRTGYPASNVGFVVEGGSVRIVMISYAACHRKFSSLTLGRGTDFGKKVTVSQSMIVIVCGK